MNSLSNPILAAPAADHLVCRLAEKADLQQAMGWVLGRPDRPANDTVVFDFLRQAYRRGIDPAGLWVATLHGQILWAILPVTSPGKTMLLFVPANYQNTDQSQAARTLTEKILAQYVQRDTVLAQILFEPTDHRIIELHKSMGFGQLAELIYLQTSLRKTYSRPTLPTGMELHTYSPHTHDFFTAAIQQSYADSLDCPALSGLRSIEDVMIGHKGAGEFDPKYWFVLMQNSQPLGVALLSPLPANQSMELVYLGLIPQARRKRLGDFLFRHALATTARCPWPRLSFAVDSLNRPALDLYFRHGMQRIGSKIALLRDLRK